MQIDLKEILHVTAITPHTTRAGLSILTLPGGRVFSCQPDGSPGDRDPGADGGYESCQMAGSVATFQPAPGKYYSFGVFLVDKL